MLDDRMTFLPIVERELRARARSRANYWGRSAVAAVGLLVCVPGLLWSGPIAGPGSTGRGAFEGLVGAAFLLCCAAVVLAADTISSERREGTLPLLLLTRVKALDILLGKFASAGVTSLLALAALLPLLALPLLSGGVTGPEAVRMALALLNTFFMALSIGLWASARGVERVRTAGAGLLVLLSVVLGPALMGFLARQAQLASPLGTVLQASDLAYQASPARYWVSLGLVQMFAWAFLLGALLSLRSRARQLDETGEGCVVSGLSHRLAPEPPPDTASPPACRYCGRDNPPEAVCCLECGTELHPQESKRKPNPSLDSARTPLHWLLWRQRGLRWPLWLAALIGLFQMGLFGFAGRFFGMGMLVAVSWTFSLAASLVEGALFAWVASRFVVEGRRTGELELLLTTPLGAEQIVSTHWDGLKRLLRWPLLVMVAPILLQGIAVLSLSNVQPESWRMYQGVSTLLNMAYTILRVAAVCWLALWFGLSGMGQTRTILWALLLAALAPYALNMAWWVLYRVLLSPAGFPWFMSLLVTSVVPQVAGLLYFVWLILAARRHSREAAGDGESFRPGDLFSGMVSRVSTGISRARQWPAP